jgi:hypothetical protein
VTALGNLRILARGDRPADDGLLGNARCAWGRGELIGEEAILAAFCDRPFTDENAIAIETDQSAALIGEGDALIADLYDGRIGRLWRVGRGIECPPETATDVAFDPDMRQQRGDLYFRAEDHPELDLAAGERIRSAAREQVDAVRRARGLRARGFFVRAFNADEFCAALLALYSMSNETRRSVGFSYSVIGIGTGDAPVRAVTDQTAHRAWTPRL